MTENDFTSGPGPHRQDEPLSATAMFLRSFDSGSAPAQETPESSAAKPAAPGPGAGPGEFTQMFQAMEQRPNAPAPPPAAPAPAQYSAPKAELQASPVPHPAPAPAPGEFTRIFVSSSAAP